jgi:tetratricopeptide (TPR) repeat protein
MNKKKNALNHNVLSLDTLFLEALDLHKKGNLSEAKKKYAKVIAINSKHFDALHLLGVIANQNFEYEKAIFYISESLSINPLNEYALLNIGNAFRGLNRIEEAINSYTQATRLNHNYAEAFFNCGITQEESQQFSSALISYEKAIKINPSYAEAYVGKGNALKELSYLAEAIESYNLAILINKHDHEAYFNKGIVLKELGFVTDAIKNYDRALEIKPDHSDAYFNKGNALFETGELDLAIHSYDLAIKYNISNSDAYWNKSLATLLKGNFKEGWELYEYRWTKKDSKNYIRHLNAPLWLGNEPLLGKTILLYAEQGFGDAIQFCRFTKLVKDIGASKVLIEVPKGLINLFECLEGKDELIEKGMPLPYYDFHCPLLSLPLAFNIEVNTIPQSNKYLISDPEKKANWDIKLGPKIRKRVGLVWSGSPSHKNDHNRSISLYEIINFLPKEFDYVCLQNEIREADKAILEASSIRNYEKSLVDFSETAALCDLMDFIITVDTSVAHLAGALGKSTWVLIPYLPDFRWLQNRMDSPWYKSVTLYRQNQDRDWKFPLERIRSNLQEYI